MDETNCLEMGQANIGLTEKGAPAYVSTLDHRLNLFFKAVRDMGVMPEPVGVSRQLARSAEKESQDGEGGDSESDASIAATNDVLYQLIEDSWRVDALDTMKILMNWRDCRGGKGDHRGFLVAMAHVEKRWPGWFKANVGLVPEYGCWLDMVKLWHMVSDEGKVVVMNIVAEQLRKDKAHEGKGEGKISLLAKWVPSERAKWDAYSGDSFVVHLCQELIGKKGRLVTTGMLKELRKEWLVPLRKKVGLVETALCEKRAGDLNYEGVPSVAMRKYREAFLRNDKTRFEEYLAEVKAGGKKINAGQVYPHDLVRVYIDAAYGAKEDAVIEEQWKAIKKRVDESGAFKDSLIVCDVSGSMAGTPMEVAVALGLLGMGECGNRLITFTDVPELHAVKGETLREQVKDVMRMNWGMSTNFQAAMDLVLGLAKEEGKAFKRLYVFSDMQFDAAFRNGDRTHFEAARARFAEEGLEMPQVVFWNLRGGAGGDRGFPALNDDKGVIMLSGFSPALLGAVMDGEDVSPLAVMMKVIRGARYEMVKAPA